MCKETAQMCCNMMPFIKAIKILISIVQWSVPLLLIVLGTIDMFKAVASNDEKTTTAAKSTFIKRLAYGVAIFLVPFVVNLILGLMEDNIVKDKEVLNDNWLSCWNGNIDCDKCDNIYENDYNTNNGNNNTGTGNGNNSTTKICYKYTIYDYKCPDKFNTLKESLKDKDGYMSSQFGNICTISYNLKYEVSSSENSDSSILCDVSCSDASHSYSIETSTCTCTYDKLDSISYGDTYSNFSYYGKVEKYECSNTSINCLGGNIESLCDLVN